LIGWGWGGFILLIRLGFSGRLVLAGVSFLRNGRLLRNCCAWIRWVGCCLCDSLSIISTLLLRRCCLNIFGNYSFGRSLNFRLLDIFIPGFMAFFNFTF
jgi:hypothetical protein